MFTLDLASGYWQQEVDIKDREKTAFASHRGLFHFKVTPRFYWIGIDSDVGRWCKECDNCARGQPGPGFT